MRSLLVAIDDYPGTKNDLNSCLSDAHYFANLLDEMFSHEENEVRVLTNEQATISAVSAGIDWLFSSEKEDEPLVLFFSGHGTPISADDDGNVDEALVLYDGFFVDDLLVEKSLSSPSNKLTLFLDCCFSAGLSKQFAHSKTELGSGFGFIGKSKAWTSTATKGRDKDRTFANGVIASYKAFGTRRIQKPPQPQKFFSDKGVLDWPAPIDEATEPSFNGIVIAACSEDEVASAATPTTNSLSAFTFAVSQVLAEHGLEVSNQEIVARSDRILKEHGFRQTPRVKYAPRFASLKHVQFLTLGSTEQIEARCPDTRKQRLPVNFAFSGLDLEILSRIDRDLFDQIVVRDHLDLSMSSDMTVLREAKGKLAAVPFWLDGSGSSNHMEAAKETQPKLEETKMNDLSNFIKAETQKALDRNHSKSSNGQDKFFPGAEILIPVVVNEVINAVKSKGFSLGVSTPIGGLGINIKGMVEEALEKRQLSEQGTSKFFPGAELLLPVVINEVIDAVKSKGFSLGVSTPIGGLGINIKGMVADALADKGIENRTNDKFFPGAEILLPVVINEVIDAVR